MVLSKLSLHMFTKVVRKTKKWGGKWFYSRKTLATLEEGILMVRANFFLFQEGRVLDWNNPLQQK